MDNLMLSLQPLQPILNVTDMLIGLANYHAAAGPDQYFGKRGCHRNDQLAEAGGRRAQERG